MISDEKDPLLPDGSASAPEPPDRPDSLEPSLPATAPYASEYPPPVPAVRTDLPADLRVPWGWTDLALFVGLGAAVLFFISLIAVRIFMKFGVSPAQIQHSPAKQGVYVFITEVPLIFVLLGILTLLMRARSRAPVWTTIGWRPLPSTALPQWMLVAGLALSGCFLSLLVAAISSEFQPKTNLPIQAFFESRLSAALLMTMAVLFAPIFEETLFRGFLYPVLARSWGVTPGVLVTGTLFGLMHSIQLWGGWVQIALLVGVGIIFTYVRAVTKTVLASYLLHVSYNSSIFLGFLFASHGLRHLPSFH
ncbi:MAG TPA: CPBP family glutamic-type intramembrane protease [Candidatus Acidoferrum sp.]|nr:CPBP family glutamic-type intramembrane protease [Candidatus Acidoferrum sp.]